MKNKVEARTLKGFRDLLPQEALIKTRMLNVLRSVFESFGFAPIETPHLEYSEVLLDEHSGEISKQVFRFRDQGDRDVCLRYDLTVPFARFSVEHKAKLNFPFKRYAIGNVFRGEQPQLGRYREFTQCDFDIVGPTAGPADAEIVQVIVAALDALKVTNYQVRINNRKLMNGLALAAGIPSEQTPDLLRVVDKYDKIGRAGVIQQLKEELSLAEAPASQILDFCELKSSSTNELLEQASKFANKHELIALGLDELNNLVIALSALPNLKQKVVLDFSIARGLGYYTGCVYETRLLDLPQLGSVCSGGRYDNLTANFTKDALPGVGASVGLDRLLAGLIELKLVTPQTSPSQILCANFDASVLPQVYKIASELRSAGLNVEVFPETGKLKKQIPYAEKQGINWVLIIGSDEISRGVYLLKDLNTGTQHELNSIEEIGQLVS